MNRYVACGAAVVAAAVLAPSAKAELLGVEPGFPLIAYNNEGTTEFEAGSGLFAIDATPLAIRFTPGGVPRFVQRTGDPGTRLISIDVQIGSDGALIGGIAGNDLVIVGQVDENGDGTPDYAGVLLTGEVLAFGFDDTTFALKGSTVLNGASLGAGAGGGAGTGNQAALAPVGALSVDQYDFRFAPTGGSLLPLFAGMDIGVSVTSEQSSFTGSFAVDFSGEAKGAIGPIEPMGLTGACCFPDGTCEILTQLACQSAGGAYQGNGTSCDDVFCPPTKRACCLPSGACTVVTETQCDALGGMYMPAVLTCVGVMCPEPEGACCFEDGTCQELDQVACILAGGIYQDDFTLCATTDCPAPGACCFEDGTCQFISQEECADLGGLFQGVGVTCDDADCPQPKGACCLASGACGVVTEEVCDALGGDYQGDFTLCTTTQCPQPPGACCFEDGSCELLTQADCLAAGGLFQGAGITCVEADCPQPKGACCLASGACVFVTESACAALGGTYQGDFIVCPDVECPQPPGACCFTDGSCLEVTQDACADMGGQFQGYSTLCADTDCPQPKGACCLPVGTCVFVTEEVCTSLGGTYQGNFLGCTAVVCPQPPGACCLDDGSCVEVTQAACAALGGVYQGNFTECADVFCPQPPGACCLIDGSCIEVTEKVCLGMGGDFRGAFVECADVVCPPPPGACCLDDGSCVEVTEEECNDMGGEFQGDLTECADVTCPTDGACCLPPPPPPPPPGDFTCTNKIVFEKMIWDGTVPIRIKAYDGLVGAPLVADIDNIQVGDEINVGPFAGPNDHEWQIFHAGTSTLIGKSKFHRSCSDDDMDGPEDCGKRQGNGKANEAGLINDWILEGLTDGTGASFDCGASGGGGTDEVCTVVSPEECEALGGAYQGNGTDCDSVECVGACCLPPPPASDFVCTNKIVFETMIWDGTVPIRIKVYDGLVGAPLLHDIDNIQVGDEVVTGPYAGPNDHEWQIFHAGTSTLIGKSKFHRSCSDDDMDGPEDCGKRQGNGKANEAGLINDWILEGLVDGSGASFDCGLSGGGDDECTVVTGVECVALGGTFQGVGTECADVECLPPLSPCCENGEKIRVLSMQYTADDCSATHHDQDPGKVTCTDFGPLPDTVFILSTDKDDPAHGGAKIWFAGTVNAGDAFDIDATNAGQARLTNDTRIHVFDHEGGTRLQFVKFHTSCSQPINAGDQYGSALVLGCVGENQAMAGEIPNPFADVTGDGHVTTDDVTAVLGSWGACGRCPADLTKDGWVDARDLMLVMDVLRGSK